MLSTAVDALTSDLYAADTIAPTAKMPGLAAPALNVYTYGAEMDGAPDTNVWTLTTAPGVNVSYPNGTVAFQRGAETFNDWTPLAVLTARPRLNFTELAGTEAAWRITLGGQQQQALVYLQLVDGDAERYFEITCAADGDGVHWNCHFTIRRRSDQAYLWWGLLFRATPVSQTPLRLGEYHTLAMRYDGGQQVTWLIDDEVALSRDFGGWIDPAELRSGATAATVWNGLDWLTLRYQVLADPRLGLPTVLETGIGYLRIQNAHDQTPPLLTTTGAPPNTWSNQYTLTVGGSDAGAGFQCLRLAWDAAAPADYPCYSAAQIATNIPGPGEHTLNLRGWDWAGNESTTTATYFALPTPVLDAPAAYSAGDRHTATWTDVSAGAVQYEVQRATDAAFAAPLSSGWLNGTSYSFSGLANCQLGFYRLRSRDGQGVLSAWSPLVSATQDAARPSGTLTIDDGAVYTNQPQVTLTLAASDDCASDLRANIRNAGETWPGWQAFSPSLTWNLTSGDGLKRLELDLADGIGGMATPAAATITLDSVRPVVTNLAAIPPIFSPNGDGRQETTTVTAAVDEANPVAWLIEVRDASGAVVRSQAGSGVGVAWTWDGRDTAGNPVADGQYAVQVTPSDAAGNATLAAASVLAVVDTQAPQGVGLFHPSRAQGAPDAWADGETYYTNRNALDVHGYTGQAGDVVTVNGAAAAVSGALNEFAMPLTLNPGAQTVTVLAADQAGNQTVLTRTVVYDDQGPTLSSYSPLGVTNQVQPLVSGLFDERGGSPIDVSQVQLYRDGVAVTASAIITPSGLRYLPEPALVEGENEFHVTLVNLAGNVGEFDWRVTVDRQSYVELLAPMDGAVLNVVTQTVSGQSEPHASVTLALSGQPLGQTTADASGNFTFTNQLFPADGLVTLTVTATDALGNQATSRATVTMAQGKPAAGVRSVPNPYATSTVFGLSAGGLPNDPLASWTLVVGGAPITSGVTLPPAQWLWDGGGFTDGTYPVRLAVTTTQGLTLTVAGPDLVRDATPPAPPIISSPADGYVVAQPIVPVRGTAEPGSAVTLSNGGLFTVTAQVDAQGAWHVTMLLEGGWNDLNATATDQAGQVSAPSNVVRVQVPVEPPLIDVGSSRGFAGLSAAVDLWADARGANHPDGPATAWVRSALPDSSAANLSQSAATQGQSVGHWTFNWTVSPTTDHGPHTLLFTAEDQLGLRGQGRTSLFVDAVLPAAPLLMQPVGELYLAQPQVQVVGQAEPLATVVVYLNDTPVQTLRADAHGNWRTTLTVSEEMNTLYATVRDAAGNQSLPALSSRLLYDHTPPQVRGMATPAIIQPGAAVTYTAVVSDASPLVRVQVRVDGVVETQDFASLPLYPTNGQWQGVCPGNLAARVYTLTFDAVDLAGNVGTGTNTLIVDNTPPTFSPLSLTGSQPYTFQPAAQSLYYGVGTDAITVTTTVTDDLAGLERVTFPVAAGVGGVYEQHGTATAVVQHVYAFDTSATFSGTVATQAADRAGNTVTSNVVLLHDPVAPILELAASSEGLTLSMAWSASDGESGLKSCALELVNGTNATTLSTACSGSLLHPAVQDASYTIRLSVGDNVANQAVQERVVAVSSVTKYYYHGSTRVAMRKGGQVYYLHGDHLGSTSLTTDAGGNVVQEARYLPYGQVR